MLTALKHDNVSCICIPANHSLNGINGGSLLCTVDGLVLNSLCSFS